MRAPSATLTPPLSQKGNAMGDKKSKKDKAKGQKQQETKQANAAKQKQDRVHPPKAL